MKTAAGTLLWRKVDNSFEVLIVHPSGSYNKDAPWSIPKGAPDEGEDAEATARRETSEETGVVAGDLSSLGSIDYQKSKKRIHCYGGEAPSDASPHTTSWEVDRAEFVPVNRARQLLHQDQAVFVDRLLSSLNEDTQWIADLI